MPDKEIKLLYKELVQKLMGMEIEKRRKLSRDEYYTICSWIRIDKKLAHKVLLEMKKMGLIDFDNKSVRVKAK